MQKSRSLIVHGRKSPNRLTVLVKQNLHQFFRIAHYHRNRVSVIIQFCHTRLAWIVCIISSCGQCEAICCKITSILPLGRSLTVCPDCLCSLIIHSLGHHTLNCMQGFRLLVLREALCLFCPQNFQFWWHCLELLPHLLPGIRIASQLYL